MKPKPTRPRIKQKKTGWDADAEAADRVEIVRAFHALMATGSCPVNAAARMLGISPSMLSGKNSLPFKLKAGGIAALRVTRRPSPDSLIGKLTQALKDGAVIVHQDRVIGGMQ